MPGRPFTFGAAPSSAQAAGDAQVLAGPGPPGAAAAPHRPQGRVSTAVAARRPLRTSLPRGGHPRVNPLRDRATGACRGSPGRAALVIFGVTGDLARKKLMPAVYDLANRGLLPPGLRPGRVRPPRLGRRRTSRRSCTTR